MSCGLKRCSSGVSGLLLCGTVVCFAATANAQEAPEGSDVDVAEAKLETAVTNDASGAEFDLEPRDEAPPPSARTNLVIVGAAATAGFYGLGYGTSYLWPSSPVADDLRIPVVGPYSAVFGAGCGDGEAGCGTFATIVRTTLASISAIGQTGGVFMLAEALLMTTDSGSTGTPVRGAASTEQPTETFTWHAAPVVDGQRVGVFVGGSF